MYLSSFYEGNLYINDVISLCLYVIVLVVKYVPVQVVRNVPYPVVQKVPHPGMQFTFILLQYRTCVLYILCYMVPISFMCYCLFPVAQIVRVHMCKMFSYFLTQSCRILFFFCILCIRKICVYMCIMSITFNMWIPYLIVPYKSFPFPVFSVPVVQKVPVIQTVERKVPVPVDRPYPVPVERKVPVAYPVHGRWRVIEQNRTEFFI